jgi:hypothetical protein
MYQSLPIKKMEIDNHSEFYNHLAIICDLQRLEFDTDIPIQRWGKCVIQGDITLRSKISEEGGQASRSSRYFEATGGVSGKTEESFGEAVAFYSVYSTAHLVVYHKLIGAKKVLGRWCGKWSDECMVMETSRITNLVGIWEYGSTVHILRRHVGLDILDTEEGEIEEEEE